MSRSKSYYNIGIDFDDIVFPWLNLSHEAVVRAGHGTLEDVPTTWNCHDHYGLTMDEWVAIIDAEIEHGSMYQTPVAPEYVAQMQEMHDLGHDFYIVTARGQFGHLGSRVKELTHECIEVSGMAGLIEEVIFTKKKARAFWELDLDFMVDDSPKNYEEMLLEGCNVYLMDQPWNHHLGESLHPQGRRVESLKHYFDIIKNTASR